MGRTDGCAATDGAIRGAGPGATGDIVVVGSQGDAEGCGATACAGGTVIDWPATVACGVERDALDRGACCHERSCAVAGTAEPTTTATVTQGRIRNKGIALVGSVVVGALAKDVEPFRGGIRAYFLIFARDADVDLPLFNRNRRRRRKRTEIAGLITNFNPQINVVGRLMIEAT